MLFERAKNYALSLFELAEQDNKLKNYYLQIELLKQILTKEYLKLLSNLMLPNAQRKQLIYHVLKNDFSQDIINFMCILIDRNVIANFADVYKEFVFLTNNHFKIVSGVIYTTYKLSLSLIEKLEALLSKKLNVTVKLKNEIDSKIIGGIVVIVGDKIFDYSYVYRLNSMRVNLIKKEIGN